MSVSTLLATALMTLTAGSALAGDISVRWELATTWEDGSAMAPSDIQSHRIEWSLCDGPGVFGTKLGELVAAMPSQEALIARIPAGEYCIRGYTIATNGEESEPSEVAWKRVRGRPGKPVVIIL